MEGGDPLRFPAELVRALDHVARAIEAGQVVHMPRRGRQEHLDELGLRVAEIESVMTSLAVRDFHAGPEPDHHRPDREVWVFGPTINGRQAYVKVALGLSEVARVPFVIVWSIHPARFPMELPLRHL